MQRTGQLLAHVARAKPAVLSPVRVPVRPVRAPGAAPLAAPDPFAPVARQEAKRRKRGLFPEGSGKGVLPSGRSGCPVRSLGSTQPSYAVFGPPRKSGRRSTATKSDKIGRPPKAGRGARLRW